LGRLRLCCLLDQASLDAREQYLQEAPARIRSEPILDPVGRDIAESLDTIDCPSPTRMRGKE
jgi:hypothetical protein